MIILGIETSCDETAAAVLRKHNNKIQVLSNTIASSASIQAKYGGIIPEEAAREQIKAIIPVIEESLQVSGYSGQKIDAIAVTYGPGLIGSLLVGVETAKTLAMVWQKPLIPINHLLGHFYANWIQKDVSGIKYHVSSIKNKKIHNTKYKIQNTPLFPCLGLLVSGGHTDLVLFTSHSKYKYLGGTRDDAAGECFDKCARLLDLSYPGGPQISLLARSGQPGKFKLPIPMKGRKDFDFSYSGLKTAVANLIKEKGKLSKQDKADLAFSLEETIIISLIEKVVLASQKYKVEQIMIAGGVAANEKLVAMLQNNLDKLKILLHVPPSNLCTDNGAMIAAAGFFTSPIAPTKIQANPSLSLIY